MERLSFAARMTSDGLRRTRDILWPLTSLTAVIVELFYCWRIYRLLENRIVPFVIGCISFTGFPFALAVRRSRNLLHS